MKHTLKLPVVFAAAAALATARLAAQTNNLPATANNPIITALGNAVVDTNSTFFAATKYQVRSGALESDSTYADLGCDLNFSRIQLSADVLTQGSANIISEFGVDIAYRIPVHNLELDPLAGAAWNWD
ncbi:MAG TPA: hypothetical protein VF988_06465, partial [Verrucomicrobiae bacterium]